MAEELESYEFESAASRKYPWEAWMNGNPWRLKRGEDFEISTRGMAQTLYVKGHKTGRKVTVRTEDDDTLVFKFFPADDLTNVVEKVKSRKKGG